MISFPYTRTRRIAVRLVELDIGEAIGICKLPASRHEVTATHLLRAIAKGAEKPLDRYVTDPRLWTVEERTMLIATYLAHVTPDGPDFAVGGGKMSDYIDLVADSTQDQADLGEVAGERRVLRPLLGVHAEALETLCATQGDWMIGRLACQLFTASDDVPDYANTGDVAMLDWVQGRMEKLRKLPESDFEALYLAYAQGAAGLRHFMNLAQDDHGMVCEPLEGGGLLSPARFLAISCIGSLAKSLSGRAD